MSEICSVFAKNTRAWRQWHRSGAFIVNFEKISYVVLILCEDFGQVHVGWIGSRDSKVFSMWVLEIWQNLGNKIVKKFFCEG